MLNDSDIRFKTDKKIEKMFLKLLEFSIKSHTRKKRISRLSLYMTLRPEFEFVNVQGA